MTSETSNQSEELRLRKQVFAEPSSRDIRPAMVNYLKLLSQRIDSLTSEELIGGEGHSVAMDITGALAFQGADGVNGDDWVTRDEEPELYEILNVAAMLDEDSEDFANWKKLSLLLQSLE